jgi:hypothetical protein
MRCACCSRACVGSILYQRAIYPPDAFTATTQYGLSMMVTTDDGLKHYLTQVLTQLSGRCTTVVLNTAVEGDGRGFTL